jgi:hypothetical protein
MLQHIEKSIRPNQYTALAGGKRWTIKRLCYRRGKPSWRAYDAFGNEIIKTTLRDLDNELARL